MNLFIKERGACGRAQHRWEATSNVPKKKKKTEHTFCVEKHFVIELFFTSTNMTFGFPVVSHISNKSLTSVSLFVRFLSGFEDKRPIELRMFCGWVCYFKLNTDTNSEKSFLGKKCYIREDAEKKM